MQGVAAPPAAPGEAPPQDRIAAVAGLLDQLQAAAVADDRAGFDRLVTSKNPAFAAQADIWFANLATFGSTLTLRATTRESVPGVGTRARFQDRAWLHEITASWRSGSAPAGRFAAQWRIWLTLVDDGDRISLAGDSDVPAADRTRPRPLWLQTAVRVDRRGPVTVLAAVGVAVDSWLVRGRASAAAVRPRITALPGPGWDGAVVVELPANQTSFERSIGVGAGSYARIGAVAWPRGAKAGTAAVHVVVNPAVAAAVRRGSRACC